MLYGFDISVYFSFRNAKCRWCLRFYLLDFAYYFKIIVFDATTRPFVILRNDKFAFYRNSLGKKYQLFSYVTLHSHKKKLFAAAV